MKYLITGGCGFLGSNIALELAKNDNEVLVFDNLYRSGSEKNLVLLEKNSRIKHFKGDVRNKEELFTAIDSFRPQVIFHLAGQVAMTTSINNPELDFQINTIGTVNLLECVRAIDKNITVVYSSTNKVYGDLNEYSYEEHDSRYVCIDKPQGFDELTHLDFHSPYGCSKGSADQYMLDYHRIYGLKTVVLRHSSIYGINQNASYDQGWVGWFCKMSLIQTNESQPFTISGNGKQVRDLLFADDAVNCYLTVASKIEVTKGKVYNVGGGFANSLSIVELIKMIEGILDKKIKYTHIAPRESDQIVFIADTNKLFTETGWYPKIDAKSGISKVLEWLSNTEDNV